METTKALQISEKTVQAKTYLVNTQKTTLAKMQETELTTIIIKVPAATLRYMQEIKYNMGLISEEKEEAYSILTFASYSQEYFARWLLMYGAGIEIVTPPELAEKVKAVVKELGEKYLK